MDDIAHYLSEGNISVYKEILRSPAQRVYRTYYLKKIDVVNGLTVQLDSLIKTEEQLKRIK